MIHPAETIVCAINNLIAGDNDDHMKNLLMMLAVQLDGLIIAENGAIKRAENLKTQLECEKKNRMKLSSTDLMARKDLKRVNLELNEAKAEINSLKHDLVICDKAYSELKEETG